MKLLLYLSLFITPAFSQIYEIATDATGQTLLFNTRFRMQTESDVLAEQKIYRWQNGIWTRLRVHTPVQAGIVPGSIGNPFVAAAGNVYGWFTTPSHGLFPPVRVRPEGELFGATLPNDFPREFIKVSANGQFAAGWGATGTGELVVPQIFNIRTGAMGRLPLNSLFLNVGSDGSFSYTVAGQTIVERPDREQRRFPATGVVWDVEMSDDARWIVMDSSPDQTGVGRKIQLFSVADGTSTEIGAADFLRGRASWRVSNTRVVYVPSTGKSLISWDPVTKQSKVISESSEAIFDLALSADGAVVWNATDTNRLTRFDLLGGTQQEILPPLGFSQTVVGVFVPGSAFTIVGKFTLEQQVFVDGERWPLSDVNAAGYWAQVPWEWRGPSGGVLLVRTAGNPFENYYSTIGYDGELRPYFPTMLDYGDSQNPATVIAAHSDFRGVVTSADPARGGENIHVYMTGLGALQRPVATGVPGALNAVPIVAPIVCSGQFPVTRERTEPLPIPAIVDAGGMIGIYQLELTLPPNIPDGSFQLACWDGIRETLGFLRTRP